MLQGEFRDKKSLEVWCDELKTESVSRKGRERERELVSRDRERGKGFECE